MPSSKTKRPPRICSMQPELEALIRFKEGAAKTEQLKKNPATQNALSCCVMMG